MKVLWFSNTPANSDEFLGKELKGTGGWLKSLDTILQEKVDLHIAFYSNDKIDNFAHLKTSYYPIHKKSRNFIDKVKDRFTTKIIFREDLDKYLKIIDNVKPDIIHIHGTELPFGYIQEKTNIPVVISIQGNITVCKHKYFSGIEKSYLRWFDNFLQIIFKNTSFLKNYKRFGIWEFGEQEILKRCKYIIGRTDWDRRITRVLAPNSKYFYVSEILRDSFYKQNALIQRKNKYVISTTNGNTLYKGFETLCHSISILNKSKFQDFEWRVAGIKETDSIVELVRKKLGKNYPEKNLLLMGSLNEKQLYSSLLETNLYVMTSHIENSPNNLSEAMILGIPCISTFAGGTGSIIENDVDGVLIQDGDPWGLAGAILELNSNPLKAKEMGERAKLKSLNRHNSDKVCEDLINAYNNIVKFHE
jgi:glycosyltransferase involved in cell wall biosynthesis